MYNILCLLTIFEKQRYNQENGGKPAVDPFQNPPPQFAAGLGALVFFGSSWGHNEELPAIKFWGGIFS